MYSDILSLVRTTEDKSRLLSEIDSLTKALFEPKKGVEGGIKELRVSTANIIRAKLAEGQNLEQYLAGLVKELESLEEIKLELASEPTENMLNLVLAWLTDNLGKGVIISLEVDPTLLGGACISFKGKYYDGSLSKMVEESLEHDRNTLINAIYSSK